MPPHQLLQYSCSQGWAPLCAFLGEIPPHEIPFPHENKDGEFGKDESLKGNPGYQQIVREVTVAVGVIGVLVLAIVGLIFYFCL